MKYLSVCSGIEAASAAWMPLGWTPVAFSEIEPFPCAVLAHHYPGVPNWGDMTKYKEWPDANVDLLCGGTPCQSFSVAGLRKGLDDPRGNLMLTFGAIAARYRPRWLVWENVPGVLSSNRGRDFGTFLGMLGQLGYGFAYRVLDAQYFGVAQRRRRVFVVGHLGDWRRAAAVLFERHSLSGHPAPRREARKVAPTIPSRSTGGGGLGTDFDCDGGLIARAVSLRGREGGGTAELGDDVQNCLRASSGGGDKPHVLIHADPIARCLTTGEAKRQDWETCNFVAFHPTYAIQAGALRVNPASGPDGVGVQADHAYTLEARAEVQAVAFAENSRAELRLECGDGSRCGALSTGGGKPGQGVPMIAFHPTQDPISSTDGSTHALGCGSTGGQASVAVAFDQHYQPSTTAQTLIAGGSGGRNEMNQPTVFTAAMQVRRLTPRECERLQGFPDDYTLIPTTTVTHRKGCEFFGTKEVVTHGTDRMACGCKAKHKPADQCPDGPRYKALGNSWAVNCARWIGERIEAVETIVALPYPRRQGENGYINQRLAKPLQNRRRGVSN